MASPPASSLTRRVGWLTLAHLGIWGGLVAYGMTTGAQIGSLRTAVILTVTLIVVGMLPMHLEFGRATYTLTIPEALYVVALFTLGPVGVMICGSLAEIAACLIQRISRLKVAYNTANIMVATMAAALTFRTLGGVPHRSESWLAASAALAVYFLLNHVSTSIVLAVVEHRRLLTILRNSALSATLTTGLAVSVGLAVHALLRTGPAVPLLLAPLVLAACLETRALTIHRAEHLRFERLYEASGRTTSLQGGFEDALRRSAEEARLLATGIAAVCLGRDRAGEWRAVVVDDDGCRDVAAAAVTGLIGAAVTLQLGEPAPATVPAETRRLAPEAATVVIAASKEDAPSSVVLAVFRAAGAREKG